MTTAELLSEFGFVRNHETDSMLFFNDASQSVEGFELHVAKGSRADEVGVMLTDGGAVIVSIYPENDLEPSLVISFSRYEERSLRSVLEVITWKGRG